MRTIYRYCATIQHHFCLMVPPDSRILHIAQRPGDPDDTITFWVEQDSSSSPTALINLALIPTGGEVPPQDSYHYVATVITTKDFVWHIYQEREL